MDLLSDSSFAMDANESVEGMPLLRGFLENASRASADTIRQVEPRILRVVQQLLNRGARHDDPPVEESTCIDYRTFPTVHRLLSAHAHAPPDHPTPLPASSPPDVTLMALLREPHQTAGQIGASVLDFLASLDVSASRRAFSMAPLAWVATYAPHAPGCDPGWTGRPPTPSDLSALQLRIVKHLSDRPALLQQLTPRDALITALGLSALAATRTGTKNEAAVSAVLCIRARELANLATARDLSLLPDRLHQLVSDPTLSRALRQRLATQALSGLASITDDAHLLWSSLVVLAPVLDPATACTETGSVAVARPPPPEFWANLPSDPAPRSLILHMLVASTTAWRFSFEPAHSSRLRLATDLLSWSLDHPHAPPMNLSGRDIASLRVNHSDLAEPLEALLLHNKTRQPEVSQSKKDRPLPRL